MIKKYYSSRNNPKQLTLNGIYWKLRNFYLLFRDNGYFGEKLGVTSSRAPSSALNEAALALNFQPFPITKWSEEMITEENVFDVIEFFYEFVSKPVGDWGAYDEGLGRAEYRERANQFLNEYSGGYELKENGMILALGEHGLQAIMDAEIVPFDEENVDSKVRDAIVKWRNRNLTISEKKAAIRDMADVFEWLKKVKGLSSVLADGDTDGLFQIANKFHIRHHNNEQKNNYDKNIWYSWMFHFYLATYHAAIRLLVKQRKSSVKGGRS